MSKLVLLCVAAWSVLQCHVKMKDHVKQQYPIAIPRFRNTCRGIEISILDWTIWYTWIIIISCKILISIVHNNSEWLSKTWILCKFFKFWNSRFCLSDLPMTANLASEGSRELIFFGFSDQSNLKAHLSFLIYQK